MIRRIIFRADGNRVIGFGHFYRLLALAEMLKENFTCVFAINQPDDHLKSQALAVCDSIIELQTGYNYVLPDLVNAENQMPFDLHGWITQNDIVVVDGYHFLDIYQSALYQEGCVQVFIDDFLRKYPFAQMIINHAPGLNITGYDQNLRLCFGLDYAILRKPFFSSFISHPGDAENEIFVSMGSADPNGFTLMVCKGLLACELFHRIHVVCTKQFAPDQLETLRDLQKTDHILLYQNISADEIVAIMNKCSHAFVAASNVLVESYARGLHCFTGYAAKNQHLLYQGFVNENLVIGGGDLQQLTEEKIKELVVSAVSQKIKKLTAPVQSVDNFKKAFADIVYGIA